MNKEEFLAALDARIAESEKWTKISSDNDDLDNVIAHRSAAWAFRVARLIGERLD